MALTAGWKKAPRRESSEHNDGRCPERTKPPARQQPERGPDKADRQARRRDRRQQIHAARGHGRGHRRLRDQYPRQPSQSCEGHRPDVEQAGVAPLNIDAERHHRRDQAEVEHRQAHRPGLADADGQKRCGDDREADDGAYRPAHNIRPRNRPVGFHRRTTTRMTNETANL